jgi:hypothetical protein
MNQNFETHDEHRFELETSLNFFLRKSILMDTFFVNKLSTSVSSSVIKTNNQYLNYSYGGNIHDTNDNFNYLKFSTFKFFFQSLQVNIPQSFSKSESLRKGVNEIPLLKFVNYLMRNGKKEHVLVKLMNTFSSLTLLDNNFRPKFY